MEDPVARGVKSVGDAVQSVGDAVESLPGVGSKVRTWRLDTFGPASELPYRRRTSDWVRLVVAVLMLAVAVIRHDHLPDWEQSLFDFFNQLPDALRSLFVALYRLGSLWAVGLVLVAALVARRWRLARDLTVAGLVAWIIARLIGELTSLGSTGAAVRATVRLGNSSPAFPVVRLAVIVAVICAAAPYLTRPTRRVGQVAVLAMALGTMYLGTGLPNAAAAAVVLGWGIAAGVHLAFGSPGGRPTRSQMTIALGQLGVEATDVQLAADQGTGATLMTARDAGGPLAIRVLGRDQADAQFLGRLWRSVVYKSTPGRFLARRIDDVEHQGYAVLRATQEGVRTPELVATGMAGPGAAVYVERPVDGVPLREVRDVTDQMLADLWQQVARMQAARMAHLDLSLDSIVVGADGPVLTGWQNAVTSDTVGHRHSDVASLLVATSSKVGERRAVAAAKAALSRDDLAASVAYMQSAALPAALRAHGRQARKDLGQRLTTLREATSEALDIEAPQLTELHRMSPTNLLMVVGTFLGVAALLSQVGSPQELWDTMSQAEWWWIALAVVVSLSTNVATAIALMGSVPIQIPLGRTTELQLSLTFANLAVPTVGGLASQVRYLQKQGVDLAAATTAGGVISGIANVVVTGGVFLVAIVLSPRKVDTGSVSASGLLTVLLIAVVVIAVVCAVIFGVPKIRAKVIKPLASAWSTITSVARNPRQIGELVFGWAANALLYAFVLYCCVAAFGPPVNYWTVVLINTAVSTLAFAVPVPGGATAVSSVGVAGALTAAGASQEVAVAASLAYQVTATFIPAVPGWLAFRNLLNLDYL